MNDIRVRVRLTNAMDEAHVRHCELAAANVRTCEVDAVVDIGEVWSVIPSWVQQQLGASQRRSTIAGPIVFDIFGRDTVDEALIGGDEVRIGCTVVNKLDLLADCANRRLIPNPAHPDEPVSKVK